MGLKRREWKAMGLPYVIRPKTAAVGLPGTYDIGGAQMQVVGLAIADRIDFLGAVSDAELDRLYRSCTAFAMPNRTLADGDTEGFGLIFLEANACGKAVIGGRAGGAVDAIIDGETGLLVDGDDTDAIAAAIRSLLGDATLREKLAAGGLAHARNHGWARSADKFLEAVGSRS